MRTAVKLPAFLEPRPRLRDIFLSGLRLLGISLAAVWLFSTMPLARAFAVCALAVAAFVGWVIIDTRGLKRRQRAMREEILFNAWLEGVNRLAVRHGYEVKVPAGKSDSTEWRERWARGLSPEDALKDWWLIQ